MPTTRTKLSKRRKAPRSARPSEAINVVEIAGADAIRERSARLQRIIFGTALEDGEKGDRISVQLSPLKPPTCEPEGAGVQPPRPKTLVIIVSDPEVLEVVPTFGGKTRLNLRGSSVFFSGAPQ